MDKNILDPKVVWVEGRCYRFFESNCWGLKSEEPYVEDDDDGYEKLMDLIDKHDDDYLVTSCGEGKFKHSFSLPEVFYRFIVGIKGSTKRNIEQETQTKVQVPNAKQQQSGNPANKKNELTMGEAIIITGSSRECILSCRRKIDLLVESNRCKIRPNYFISIPLNTNVKIFDKFIEFKKAIIDNPDSKRMGIVDDLFVSENKLHLTIGVMLLIDDNEQQEAISHLEKCVNEIIKPLLNAKNGPLVFKIQGVDVFRDRRYDLKQTNILFAKVSPSQLLQDIANKIYLYFFEKGIMKENKSKSVQLHMTLMKSSKLIDTKLGNHDKPPNFDATKIMQDYKDYEFGEAVFDTLQICDMESDNDDGSYKNIVEIDLSK
ncbi:hypothetical protein HCN44_002589 [Aphidius gifuensis]|uniref:K Homology domain-containing protein n=1 Tax=Aphidius gifuensis TaxID=684658 RepID=A0A834Y0G8_APHGI|nr:activating signal cointegrator 1 complex subunit 1 [Aphidius gifuensis]KAF7996943.1 hypothetical protein HCN44_002589 [Aphidius gifuensis]